MIARFSGAVLGLLAFGVATVAGLIAGNSPVTVLSRALWALVLFCVIGLVVGTAAQTVVNEYITRKSEEVLPPEKGKSKEGAQGPSTGDTEQSEAE